MTEEERKAPGAQPIREAIARAIRKTGNSYAAALETVTVAVRDTLAVARRGGSSIVGALTYIALGAIRGVFEIGGDLAQACKGIVVGILHGSGDRGEAALQTISHTARTILHHTARTGSDVTSVTAGLVEGAIEGALDSGVDVTRAASAAAQGALEGAEEVSFTASEQVRAALTAHFHGVRILLLPPYQQQER